MLMITIYAEQKKRHRYIEQSFRLCGRRRGWDVSREQHRNVYYLGWNRSPAQVGCIRQALGSGALGRPRGIKWRGRWEGGLGWGRHVNPWLFHFNVWQNPLQKKKKAAIKKKKLTNEEWLRVMKMSPSYHNILKSIGHHEGFYNSVFITAITYFGVNTVSNPHKKHVNFHPYLMWDKMN